MATTNRCRSGWMCACVLFLSGWIAPAVCAQDDKLAARDPFASPASHDNVLKCNADAATDIAAP